MGRHIINENSPQNTGCQVEEEEEAHDAFETSHFFYWDFWPIRVR